MAFKKSFNEIIGTVLVLSALLSTASAVDCRGKSFHCVNSTHFMICVDLGGGVSHSIDNFLIPCPAPTVCHGTNHFECEFPAPTTPVTILNVISETTQPWEDVVVTTNSPQTKTTKEYSEKYLNTESLGSADSVATDTTVDYTTEVPSSSAPIDLNNINVTESVSIVPESSVYETTTTVDTITEPTLIYGTTTNLDQVVNTNFTAEVITEIPQTIPENIATGAIEVTTDISQKNPENIATGAIGVTTEIPQSIPENIATGAIEVTTGIPIVDISTVKVFISNASDIPQILPESITTGAGEVITEIPLVDISTGEDIISNASDIPQILPESITTGAGGAITEVPLVDISTVEAFISNASDIPQILPENITTGAGEVITEIPLVDISTGEDIISNASDIPQILPESITAGAGEAMTEVPLVDISTGEDIISNASDIPQILPESMTTGAGQAITEVPLVDISTVEAFISNASDIPQIITENITTGAGEAITEIPLVDVSTVNINNIVTETTPSTISADSSSNSNVNLTPLPENTTNINITSNATVNVKDYADTTLSTLNTDTMIGTEQVVITKTEESYTTEVSLTNNKLGSTGNLVQNGATLEQTTSDYLTFDMESIYTNQPSTIGPEEILTTDTTVNLITELPALNEHNPLNRLPTTIKTVVTQDSVTINSVATENTTIPINQKDQTQTDDVYTTERSLIVTKNDQVQSISTDDKLYFTTKITLSMNKTDIVTDANTNNFTVENIISSLQNKIRTKTNETRKNQEERVSTTESGLFKDNTETKGTKSTVADLPTTENKTDTNILANTIFDTVISKTEVRTEKPTPDISDKNLQTVANEITTATPLISASSDQTQQVNGDLALGTEKTTLITENKVIINNTNLINEKTTQNITTQFPQHQEASTIEIDHIATEQSNINTSDNAVTTENSVYLTTDTSILTTIEVFGEKLQSIYSTEQPVTVTFDEKKIQTIVNDNVKTERPIFSTTNKQAPLKLNDEKDLGKGKPIFIKSDNFEKDVNNNFTFEDSKVKVQPEIMVVTTDSPTNTDILQSDSLTTVTNSLQTAITIEDKPYITNSNTIPTIQDVMVTADAVNEEVNHDKLSLSYDSETTMATTVDILIPAFVKTNSPKWGDTTTTYNPLEASSIFEIQSDLNKQQANEKVFEGSVTTTIPTVTNLDYTTTERDLIQNNLPLDTINDGFGSTNQNEKETIRSNINVKKTTLTNEKETKPEITSETTTEDNQISTADNIEVQENTSASLGTTENINVVAIASSVTLGGTNATGQSSQDTEMDSSIPYIPVTETNIISQTNQNSDVSIDQLETNIRIDAVNYTTVAVDNVSSTDNSVTESTKLSVNSDLGNIDNNITPQQSQTTSEFIDKGNPNLLETVEGSTNSNQIISDSQANTIINKFNQDSEQTNVAGVLVTNDKTTTENLQANTTIDKLNQDSEQTNVAGIVVTNYKTITENLQANTTIDKLNQNSEQTNVAGVLVTNDKTTTENLQVNTTINKLNQDSEQTNVAVILVTNDKTTTENLQANTTINKLNQDAEQTNVAGILVTSDKTTTENLQENTTINKLNQDSEQTNGAGILVTNVLNNNNTSSTESNTGQTSIRVKQGFDVIEKNILNQQNDKGPINVIKSIEGSTNSNQVISDSQANTVISQDSNPTKVAGTLITNPLNEDKATTTESKKHELSSSVNSGLDTIENNIINQQSQVTSELGASNVFKSIEGSTNSNQVISHSKANTVINQVSDPTKVEGTLIKNALNNDKAINAENDKGRSSSSVHSGLERIENIISQQSQTTSESIDKGTSNVLKSIEGNSNKIISEPHANTIINKSIQDADQTNVAGTLVTDASNDNKTMTESSNGPTITKAYPQSINDITSKDIIITAASINEDLPSTGLKNSESASNLADDLDPSPIATQTTKTVNNSIDNHDVSSSSVPVRNNETKYTVLENIQHAVQAIGDFFNIASKNSTRAIGNEAETENNIQVSEVITEANTATESETVLDSTVFNNLQISKASESDMVPKPDANIKWGSTETAPNKGQNIENKNINKPVGHIVFEETGGLSNKAEDQVTANVEVSKTIMSEISPEMVMEPGTLDILTTNTNEIGSDGTANEKEGDSLSTYNSKVNEIEITTESYKSVISNSATIVSRTTSVPSNLLQNLPLPRLVPEAENIPIVNPKELAISSTSEKTITNGVIADIGPVFVNVNTNLNEKPNVENVIARENTAHNIRPISTWIPENSLTDVNNIHTDITSSITDSTFGGNTQKDLSTSNIKPKQISGSAQNKKPPTYDTNSGTRNPANVISENIHQTKVPSNQQSDLTGQQNAPVSTVGKEINPHLTTTDEKISAVKATRPQNNTQKITSTGTVFPRNNSSAAPKNTSQSGTKNIVSVISSNNTIGGSDQKTTNVQQNTSVNTAGQFKRPVTSTKKPVHKPNSSLASSTQTVTENPKKQVVNNTQNYSCINGVRGRYSDKDDCRKFYICIGNTEPIIGHCPVNAVFSDIKKLCTKNMSHCIRDNEFKCPSDGRFSDVIKDAVYYICVNYKNHLYRFKFQCQKGFTLNKTTVRCVENKEIESNESVSISSDNDSESSDSTSSTSTISKSSTSSSTSSSGSNTSGDSESNSSKSKQKKEKSEGNDEDDDEVFECEKQGKFPVRNDCKRYYLCKKNRKGQYRRKLRKCDSDDVFHKSKRKCVDADDYEC